MYQDSWSLTYLTAYIFFLTAYLFPLFKVLEQASVLSVETKDADVKIVAA
jgi:hypothetical protein